MITLRRGSLLALALLSLLLLSQHEADAVRPMRNKHARALATTSAETAAWVGAQMETETAAGIFVDKTSRWHQGLSDFCYNNATTSATTWAKRNAYCSWAFEIFYNNVILSTKGVYVAFAGSAQSSVWDFRNMSSILPEKRTGTSAIMAQYLMRASRNSDGTNQYNTVFWHSVAAALGCRNGLSDTCQAGVTTLSFRYGSATSWVPMTMTLSYYDSNTGVAQWTKADSTVYMLTMVANTSLKKVWFVWGDMADANTATNYDGDSYDNLASIGIVMNTKFSAAEENGL